jgi:hypothetical protein
MAASIIFSYVEFMEQPHTTSSIAHALMVCMHRSDMEGMDAHQVPTAWLGLSNSTHPIDQPSTDGLPFYGVHVCAKSDDLSLCWRVW